MSLNVFEAFILVETMVQAMSDLKRLQEEFLKYLQEGDHAIEEAVVGTEKVGVETRLGIYSNAYRYRLLEAMQETFPALHTLLGDDRFESMGFHYIDQCPSTHFSIRYFGDGLAAFLLTDKHYSQQPILAEMAAFEWTLREAFDGGNAERTKPEDLAVIAFEHWAALRFSFHPTVRRLDLSWNVPQLWQAIEDGADPQVPDQYDYPIGWLVWRHSLRTYYRSMDVDEAWAVDMVMEGGSFGDLCEGLCEWIDEENAAPRAAGFLSAWIKEGLIAGISLG